MPTLSNPATYIQQGYNPLAFYNQLAGGNINASVNTGYNYSGDPGISNRSVTDPTNPFGDTYADAANQMTQITPGMMQQSAQSVIGTGNYGSAPEWNGFTPQSPGAYVGAGSYQGYTAAPYSGSQVSAPGAWGGYDIQTPGGWTSRDIDINTTATQDAINAQLPWIAEQRDLGFADAASRAGQSGFAMSTPYMESLGGVARKAASDTQAMAEQFLFQAEESTRQRELQAEMQQLQLEKEAWEAQGNWSMAAQVQEAQNSLSAWQSQGQMDLAAQMANQQTGLGAYQTQQGINAANAAGQNQFGLQSAQMQNDYQLALAQMLNQAGLSGSLAQNQFNQGNYQFGVGAQQNYADQLAAMMASLGYGAQMP